MDLGEHYSSHAWEMLHSSQSLLEAVTTMSEKRLMHGRYGALSAIRKTNVLGRDGTNISLETVKNTLCKLIEHPTRDAKKAFVNYICKIIYSRESKRQWNFSTSKEHTFDYCEVLPYHWSHECNVNRLSRRHENNLIPPRDSKKR